MNNKYNTFLFGSNVNTILLQLDNRCDFFNSFGIFVQAILGLIILGILICKFKKPTSLKKSLIIIS